MLSLTVLSPKPADSDFIPLVPKLTGPYLPNDISLDAAVSVKSNTSSCSHMYFVAVKSLRM